MAFSLRDLIAANAVSARLDALRAELVATGRLGGAPTPTPVPTPTPTPTPAPTPTPPPAPTQSVVLPAGARYARDVKQWGVNAPFDAGSATKTAAALNFLGTRWVRQQFSGDNRSAMTALQAALVSGGYSDPTLRLNLLLNGYINNAQANTWTAQQAWILSLLGTTGPGGQSILRAIEGPNEMNNAYVGNGSRGLNDSVNQTGQAPGGAMGVAPNPTADANFVTWATALHDFRQANPSLAGVELLSPTVIYFLGANFPADLNVSSLVDYGTYHYYAGVGGGTGGIPSQQGNPGNLTQTYGYAQAGISPGKSMVMSEGGASTETGSGGYSQRAAACYHPMALLDFFRLGGHRSIIYNLFNNDVSTQASPTSYNEDNFGLFWPDGSPKDGAITMRNTQDLLSLGLSADNAANLTDTAAFTPGYDASLLTITGLTNAGTSGSSLVLPKSDGTTMIALWREPVIDTGGAWASPAGNAVTVDLGVSRTWAVYDVTGGAGQRDFTATRSLAPIARGTGRTVPGTLFGVPVMIEVQPG